MSAEIVRILEATTLAQAETDKSEPFNPDVFLSIHEHPEPGPQKFILEDLIPEGFPSLLFGLGGGRKSWLALIIAFHIAIGRALFGKRVEKGSVLFLDGEMDLPVFLRRAYAVMRGMGLEKLPINMIYRRVESLTNDLETDMVARFVKQNNIVLTVIDSWSGCIPCDDVNSADDVLKRMKVIAARFGTVLVVDHTRKTSEGDATPFGSVAKVNFSRSVLQLTGTADGAVLKQVKSNFGASAATIAFALNFSDGMVCLDEIGLDDARVEDAAHVIPSMQRIQAAFKAGRFDAGANVKDVADALDMKEKTARNKISILTTNGILKKVGALWFRADAPMPQCPPKEGGGMGLGHGGRAPAGATGAPLGHGRGESARLSGRDAQIARGDE